VDGHYAPALMVGKAQKGGSTFGLVTMAYTIASTVSRNRQYVPSCRAGNSWTEAMQVPMHQNFCAVLEHELSHCLGRPVEVINFGVSGYSTAQEFITLRDQEV